MIRVHLTFNKERGAYDLHIVDPLPLEYSKANNATNEAIEVAKSISDIETRFELGFEREEDNAEGAVAIFGLIQTPVSLRIHTKDGKIKEERTYPRSADPKETKG